MLSSSRDRFPSHFRNRSQRVCRIFTSSIFAEIWISVKYFVFRIFFDENISDFHEILVILQKVVFGTVCIFSSHSRIGTSWTKTQNASFAMLSALLLLSVGASIPPPPQRNPEADITEFLDGVADAIKPEHTLKCTFLS